MNRSVFKKRMASFREQLAKIPPDGAWIIQPDNRRYLSGFKAEDAQLNESSGSLFITGRKACLITDSRYTVEAEKEAADFKVITQKSTLQDELLRQIKKKLLSQQPNLVNCVESDASG